MLKKLLLLTLCLVCLLCGCGAQQSQTSNSQAGSQPAPVGGDFKFWLSDVTCKAGETVEVEIRLSQKSQVAASDLIIEYDTALVEYQSFQGGGVFQSEAALQSEGTVKVTSVTLTPPEDECVVGTLTFKAKEGVTGKAELKLISETCANYDLVDMVPVCFSGSVTIE